jgi:hypothetical protein
MTVKTKGLPISAFCHHSGNNDHHHWTMDGLYLDTCATNINRLARHFNSFQAFIFAMDDTLWLEKTTSRRFMSAVRRNCHTKWPYSYVFYSCGQFYEWVIDSHCSIIAEQEEIVNWRDLPIRYGGCKNSFQPTSSDIIQRVPLNPHKLIPRLLTLSGLVKLVSEPPSVLLLINLKWTFDHIIQPTIRIMWATLAIANHNCDVVYPRKPFFTSIYDLEYSPPQMEKMNQRVPVADSQSGSGVVSILRRSA